MNRLGRRDDFEALFSHEHFSPLKLLKHLYAGGPVITEGNLEWGGRPNTLPALAARLDGLRESKGLSAPKMAYEAGISALTMRLLLPGKESLLNLISTLRVLGQLEVIGDFLTDVDANSGNSPLKLLQVQRRRATGSRGSKAGSDEDRTDRNW